MNFFRKPSQHDEEMERRAAELREEEARWAAEGGSQNTVPEGDNFDKDQHIMELEAVLTSMQQELHEKDDQIMRLEAALGELEQDLAATDPNSRDHVLTEVRQAAALDRASAMEQQALMEQRMVDLQSICQEKEEQLVQLETSLQQSEETLYQQQAEIQAAVNEKDQRIADLEHSLATIREAQQTQHAHGKDHTALVEQAKKAVEGEARAQQLLQEKAQHIQQLEVATTSLQQEAAGAADKDRHIAELQARLGKMEAEIIELRNRSTGGDVRAEQLQQALEERDAELARFQAEMTMTSNRGELVEAEKKAILQQAASMKQEMTRMQADLVEKDKHVAHVTDKVTVLQSSHNSSESEVTRLQMLLAEKDHHIAQLRQAAAATGMGETEKHALLQQALDAQAKVAQLTKTNEEERTLLRSRLTQQFEAEYAGLRAQLSQVQREANAAVQARDERVKKLEQLVVDYENRLTARDEAVPTAQPTTLPECDGSTTTHASCEETQRAMGLSLLEAHKGTIQEQLSQAAAVASQHQIDPRLQQPLNGSGRAHFGDLTTQRGHSITEPPHQAQRLPMASGSPPALLRHPTVQPNVQPAPVTVRRRAVSPPPMRPAMRFPFSAHPLAAVNGAQKIASPCYGSLAVPVSGVSGVANAPGSGASPLRGGSPLRSFVAVAAPPVKGMLASPVAATATASPLRLRQDSGQVPAQAGCSTGVLLGTSFKQVPVGPLQIASPVQVASPLASPLRMRPGDTVQMVRAASPVAFRVPMMPPNLVSQPPAVVRRTVNTAPIPSGLADPNTNRWLLQEGPVLPARKQSTGTPQNSTMMHADSWQDRSGSGLHYAPEGPTNLGHSHRSEITMAEGGD